MKLYIGMTERNNYDIGRSLVSFVCHCVAVNYACVRVVYRHFYARVVTVDRLRGHARKRLHLQSLPVSCNHNAISENHR